MRKFLCLMYGVVAYVLFLGTFSYACGFIGGFVVPKGVDDGSTVARSQAIVANVLLLGLFAAQHTIMARPTFKRWWTKFVPVAIERSTFVLFTCVVMGLMFWQWRPLTTAVWQVDGDVAKVVLWGLFAFGWLLVLYSSFLIDHFDLFGLRQVVLNFRGIDYTDPPFAKPALYRMVRNPLMLGFLIAFWSTPAMTQGHLLFAVVTSAYIFVGIWFEERTLLGVLGEDYRRYRATTPMVLPFIGKWSS